MFKVGQKIPLWGAQFKIASICRGVITLWELDGESVIQMTPDGLENAQWQD